MLDIVSLFQHLWKRTEVLSKGCWSWCGCFQQKTRHGLITINNRTYYVHRLAFCVLHKLDYDDRSFLVCHTCNVTHCWNPIHLYKGTNSSNMIDAVRSGTHKESRKTHCISGHLYNEENTLITNKGKRVCRVCRRLSEKKNYRERRQNA